MAKLRHARLHGFSALSFFFPLSFILLPCYLSERGDTGCILSLLYHVQDTMVRRKNGLNRLNALPQLSSRPT